MKEHLDTRFTVYTLVNTQSVFGYPKIGISLTSQKVINIATDHISIDTVRENDKRYFDTDYEVTEQYFHFDLAFLDDIVESYIGTNDYSFIAYFKDTKEIVLAYRSVYGSYKEENLLLDANANTATREIISVIHDLLQSIKV